MPFGTGKRRKSKPEDKPSFTNSDTTLFGYPKPRTRPDMRVPVDAEPRWTWPGPDRLAVTQPSSVRSAPRHVNPNTGMKNRRSGFGQGLGNLRTAASKAFSSGINKAAKVNRAMFPSLSQAAADMPRPRVNAANFPAQGYAKQRSTKADQPARARFGDLRRSARRTRLKIPGLGGR